MLVTVIARLCLLADPASCVDRIVTDQATLMQCSGPFGEQATSKWMVENGYLARGYRLDKWGCAIGGKRVPA